MILLEVTQDLSTGIAYLWVVLGILISFIIPVLMKLLKANPLKKNERGKYWELIKPYVIILAISLVVGILVLALLGDTDITWQVALIGGYTWDSLLQKFGTS